MSLIKTIEYLSGAKAISGHEHKLAFEIKEMLEKKLGYAYIDNMGNVIACKKSPSSTSRVMLEAHMDEIGLIVNKIDENGFLYFVPIGGIDPRILPGSTVIIEGKNSCFSGIIGAKPPHVMSADEYDKVIGFDKLFIDAGFSSSNEAEEYVSIGTPVYFESEFIRLKNNLLSSKSMDDRASVAVLLDIADKLSDTELPYDLYICICVQEELGLRGSVTAAYSVNPDFAIAIDVTHAKTPDESKLDITCDSTFAVCKGPNIHPKLEQSFIEFLEKESMDYELEIEGGNTGTDAWAIQTSREGIPVMLLSLPLKYMHTPIETLSLKSCEALSTSVFKFLESIKDTEAVLC